MGSDRIRLEAAQTLIARLPSGHIEVTVRGVAEDGKTCWVGYSLSPPDARRLVLDLTHALQGREHEGRSPVRSLALP